MATILALLMTFVCGASDFDVQQLGVEVPGSTLAVHKGALLAGGTERLMDSATTCPLRALTVQPVGT